MASDPNFQDMLDERRQRQFIGRQDHLNFFRQNLRLPLQDDRRYFIINVWGNGGVGKTRLIHRFRKQAHQAGAVTAFIDRVEKDIPGVMEQIANQIMAQNFLLKKFMNQYETYRQRRHELDKDPEAPEGLAGHLAQLAFGVVPKILLPGSGPYGPILDWAAESGIAEQVGKATNYVFRKLANRDESKLVLDPLRILTSLFLSDLRTVAKKYPVVLFFDSYGEEFGQELDQWLRDLLAGQYGPVSLNLMVVISGRQELDRVLWNEFEEMLARLQLDAFTEEETDEYLRAKGIMDEATKNALIRASMRLPVLLAMLTAALPRTLHTIGDPSENAVDLFLRNIKDPKHRSVVLDCALPHYINRDIVSIVVGEREADKLWDWLREMPFIEALSTTYRYHPVAREMMLRHKKRISPEDWNALHSRLEAYHRERRDKLGLSEEMGMQDDEWRAASLEVYYHHLCQIGHSSIARELNWFLPNLMERRKLTQRYSVTQAWAGVMRQAGHDSGMADLETWGERLTTGLRAYDEAPYQPAIDLFTTLLAEPLVEERWHPIILGYRGNVYRRIGEYSKSLDDLDQVIRSFPRLAWALAGRAATYWHLEKYDLAIADLDRALKIEPDFAPDLAMRGVLLAKLERFNEAMVDLEHAIALAPDSPHVILNVCSALHLMKRFEEAISYINRYIESHPDDQRAYKLKSQIYRDWKRDKPSPDLSQAEDAELKAKDDWLDYHAYSDYKAYSDRSPMC